MSRKAIRFLPVLLSVFVLAGMMIAGTGNSYAADEPIYLVPATLWEKCEHPSGISYGVIAGVNSTGATLVSIKSSDPKVIKAKKTGTSLWQTDLKPKKAGKAKITVKYEYGGQTYKTSAKYVVKKYPKYIKKLVINGKKVEINKDVRYAKYYSKYKKNEVKIKAKLKKGWKIKRTTGYLVAGSQVTQIQPDPNAVIKGTAIDFPAEYDSISIVFESVNKKGDVIKYGVRCNRK